MEVIMGCFFEIPSCTIWKPELINVATYGMPSNEPIHTCDEWTDDQDPGWKCMLVKGCPVTFCRIEYNGIRG